jgi:hypothetical protein
VLAHDDHDLPFAENRRFGAATVSLSVSALQETSLTSVYRRFVLECLGDGQDWSVSRMRRQAMQLETFSNEDGSTLGRKFHAALIGLKQQGLVEVPEPGHWRLVRPQLVAAGSTGAA